MSDLHLGFQRSDTAARQEGLFAFLDRVNGLTHIQAIKQRMNDLLAPGAHLGGAVECDIGDAQHLELADAVVDGARAERVLSTSQIGNGRSARSHEWSSPAARSSPPSPAGPAMAYAR
jgi:hypothetical protein